MMPPEQVHLIRQWIEKAEEDYTNAEYTLTLQVEARYPGDWDIISRREAEDAFAAACAVRQTISAELLGMLGPCKDA